MENYDSEKLRQEIEDIDKEVEKEWEILDRESKIDWDKFEKERKHEFATALKGQLGQDIKNVTSGKTKVKTPFRRKIKHWMECLFKKFE